MYEDHPNGDVGSHGKRVCEQQNQGSVFVHETVLHLEKVEVRQTIRDESHPHDNHSQESEPEQPVKSVLLIQPDEESVEQHQSVEYL